MSTLFMFSGQGSHYYQMGCELFRQDLRFREELHRLDAIVREQNGYSVIAELYSEHRKKSDLFDRIELTHPAIYMVQCALVRSLEARGVRPDAVLGASLGTFVAAAVAGCYSFDDGLRMVLRQARILGETRGAAGMLAVLADPDLFVQDEALFRDTEFAGRNYDSHFVISGGCDALQRIEAALTRRGIAHQRLSVGYAFHSKWIEPLAERFRASASQIAYLSPRLPLICCARAMQLDRLTAGDLWAIVRGPIRFQETIRYLERRSHRSYRYIDVGPSGTLASFAKYNLGEQSTDRVASIMTPFGQDAKNLQRLCA